MTPPNPDTVPVKALELTRRVGDFEPAAAGRQERDVGGAAGEHVDDAVADHDRAAADHGAALDLQQAAKAARYQRAGVGDGAAHDRGAAAAEGHCPAERGAGLQDGRCRRP